LCAVCPPPLAQVEKSRQARPKKASTDRKGPANEKLDLAKLTRRPKDRNWWLLISRVPVALGIFPSIFLSQVFFIVMQ
jgi:hypothetical protein